MSTLIRILITLIPTAALVYARRFLLSEKSPIQIIHTEKDPQADPEPAEITPQLAPVPPRPLGYYRNSLGTAVCQHL